MPVFAAVVLAALLFENDHLGAAWLLDDLCPYRRARNDWSAHLGRLAAKGEDLGQRYFSAYFARDPLDRDLIADADAVLFSACLYDCEHRNTRTQLNIGAPNPCQRIDSAPLSDLAFAGKRKLPTCYRITRTPFFTRASRWPSFADHSRIRCRRGGRLVTPFCYFLMTGCVRRNRIVSRFAYAGFIGSVETSVGHVNAGRMGLPSCSTPGD